METKHFLAIHNCDLETENLEYLNAMATRCYETPIPKDWLTIRKKYIHNLYYKHYFFINFKLNILYTLYCDD